LLFFFLPLPTGLSSSGAYTKRLNSPAAIRLFIMSSSSLCLLGFLKAR